MHHRRDVEIQGEQDVILRAWLYVPQQASHKFPAISMCHGFAGIRQHALTRFAEYFAEAGFVVLLHDHRGFGASDGAPRHDIDPWLQVADWRRAISFLERQPEVDKGRIGVWGTSYSGGHALVLGATDPRVRCVVSQVPTISGFEQTKRRVSPDAMPSFLARLTDDLRRVHQGESPLMQAVVSSDPSIPAAYRASDAIAFYLMDVGDGEWENQVTVRSSFAASQYEPGLYVDRISPKPLMMLVATHDTITLTDLELKAYERALEPKRLVLVPGGHFAPYTSEFSLASSAAAEWFREHL
ncbi:MULTISPECIES: alpha/beta hydrolase [unclassified Cupriavidus]|uniref:alpha/beta hydrolase n=1 Tax=unclassified Cupriavidus TaxID=2640874 RepID=UPI00313A760C